MEVKFMSKLESAKKKTSDKKQPTIYELLKEDHKNVKKLFKEILDEEQFKKNIFSQIKEELTVHMEGEEKLFYPKLENDDETHQMVLEAYEEHDAGKQVIKDLDKSANLDEDRKLAKIKVLSDMIDHHIEEEENELFKGARKVLSKDDEMDIGRRFEEKKASSM
jgi:hemerythrin superfamily protein